jgi:chromosome segregation ATPase
VSEREGGRGAEGGTEGGREGSSSSSAGQNWLAEEEIKLLETLRQCGREAEREWSRMQRSNPELKKIPMPNLGVAAQDRMMKDVKWLLRRKVDELDARAKRMSLRIQSLETDAGQADSRRADLERTIASMVHSHERKLASMAHSHERELQDADRKHQALLGEKEVLLDELAKYNSELQHMKSHTADIKDVVETYKLAKNRCMTSTAELQIELNEVRNALEDEIARAKDLERQSERERVEAEVKIGMLESEVRRAQEEVEKEKRRSTHAISEMQRKLSVWSEEGSLAIQEAKRMAEAAEARAHVLEERLEKEVEKELRGGNSEKSASHIFTSYFPLELTLQNFPAERENFFHDIASEQVRILQRQCLDLRLLEALHKFDIVEYSPSHLISCRLRLRRTTTWS